MAVAGNAAVGDARGVKELGVDALVALAGALVCALTSLAASGTGVTGIFGILLCLAQPVQYVIMFAVAALVSFAVSFVLYKDEPKASERA